MMRGALEVLAVVLPVGLYLLVVGAGARLVLARLGVGLPRSLALTVGVGTGLSACGVGLAWALVDAPAPAVVVLGALALALGTAAALLPSRTGDGTPARRLAELLPTADDVVAGALAAVALAPLLRLGRAPWTLGTNDFPSYVASAQVWTDPVRFAALHPDAFGHAMAARAAHEKPMVTALLVVLERAGGVPAWALLTPVMLLGVFLVAGVALVLVRSAIPELGLVGRVACLVPVLSVVPMSRVYDAQPGQVVASALAAVTVAFLGILVQVERGAGAWVGAVLAGLVAAACLGSNVTLVVASGVTVLALLLWLTHRAAVPLRTAVRHLCRAGAVAVLVSIPFATGYRRSVEGQSQGGDGFDVRFPDVTALLGLQRSLSDSPGGRLALAQWAVVVLVWVLVLLAAGRWSRSTAVFLAVVLANGAVVLLRLGADSYGMHKWLAFALWLVGPVLVGLVAAQVRRVVRHRAAVNVAVGTLVVGAAANCVGLAGDVGVVMPRELLDLAGDEQIAAAGTVNIDLGNQYENSFAALVIESPTVVTGVTYARPSPREGDWILVRTAELDQVPADEVVPLNAGFALVDLDDVLTIETVRFDDTARWSGHLLDGRWYSTESLGTWSAGEQASITFEVDDVLRGRDVAITLTGARFATAAEPRSLTLSVEDGPSVSTTFRDMEVRETVLVVPAEVVDAADGQIVLRLETPDPISPLAAGVGPDARVLGYFLTSLEIAPA